jgi:hypothetical protein
MREMSLIEKFKIDSSTLVKLLVGNLMMYWIRSRQRLTFWHDQLVGSFRGTSSFGGALAGFDPTAAGAGGLLEGSAASPEPAGRRSRAAGAACISRRPLKNKGSSSKMFWFLATTGGAAIAGLPRPPMGPGAPL